MPQRDPRRLSTSLPRALAVGVFARAPVAGRAKTRLIPLLGAHGAAELQTALILDTARKVNELSRIAERWFFCAGGTYPDFAGHSEWTLAEQRGRDLGARVDRAFQTLLRLHEAAVIIGTDSPLLATRTLHRALTELRVCEAVLGPCPDGGFYLMGLRRPVPRIFRGVRWGTRFAFRDMRRNLVGAELSCSILEPVPDVDRPADVLALARRLRKEPAKRQQAPALWRIVKARRLALELPAKRKARGSDN